MSENNKNSTDDFSASQLKDLFTINPSTLCNTHDLIGCNCAFDSNVAADDSISLDEPGSDDDEDFEIPKGFVSATQVNTDKYAKAALKQTAGLAALKDWKHINCLDPSAAEKLHDSVLRGLLPIQSSSAEDSCLEDADDDLDSQIGVGRKGGSKRHSSRLDSLSGGTLTFLFEKKSKALSS
ncbi:helicase [Tulasnella sp. 419]|nr:helicase [Tulasnella sp. 419]